MAHGDQLKFFDIVVDQFPGHFAGRVLDIGSLDINGGPRGLFTAAEYVGVDVAEGPNVDVVSRGEDLQFPTGSFDVTMSSECFEHNPAWRATLHNMIRMTRSGGIVAFSTATTGRPEHGTTRSDRGFGAPLTVAQGQEYYANVTVRQVRQALGSGDLSTWFTVTNDRMFDLYFVGIKSPVATDTRSALAACESTLRSTYESRDSYEGWGPYLRGRALHGIAVAAGDRAIEKGRRIRSRMGQRAA